MIWEVIFLGILISSIGVAAIAMAIKSKNNTGTTIIQGNNVDIEKLATSVATAVGKEMANQMAEQFKEILKNMPSGSNRSHYQGHDNSSGINIEMDESIIPIALDKKKIEGNLEGMGKEEIKIDKGLGKSKSKLKALLGKKKKE